VSGEKSFRNRGYSTIASSRFLTLAFQDLGLHVINTWAVEHNPSLKTIERLGFRLIGRQRRCHCIDGRLFDRLLFDLLASEHRDVDEARRYHLESSHRGPVGERLPQPG
jgi:RimJ/RimL family protein N-acetyltransferase